MKVLSEDELRMNEQAATMAAEALSIPVEAATRCEQLTVDMAAGAAGVSAMNRGMMRGMTKMTKFTSVGKMGDGIRSAGLPDLFILAVSANHVHAVEAKEHRGTLVAGKELRSWDREGFQARVSAGMANMSSGVPEDRQVIILTLPIEGGNNRYLKAAAQNLAAIGGKPYKFAIPIDAASQGLIDAICKAGAGPTVMIGGTHLQDLLAQAGMPAGAPVAAAAPDPTERLTQLAKLRDGGVLTEEEFSSQKAKILGAM
jgi:hypothetical protein